MFQSEENGILEIFVEYVKIDNSKMNWDKINIFKLHSIKELTFSVEIINNNNKNFFE